jgi:hypothetical protein
MNSFASDNTKPTISYLQGARAKNNRFPIYNLLDDLATLAIGSSTAVVTTLEFFENGDIRPAGEQYRVGETTHTSIRELTDYLNGLQTSNNNCKRRLYLLENPSIEAIELLGNRLGVDPAAFASFIYCPNRANAKDHCVAGELPSRQSLKNTFSLKYEEIRHLPHDAPQVEEYRIAVPSNIGRSVSTFAHRKIGKGVQYITAAVRRNASFWYHVDDTKGSWNGTVLQILQSTETDLCQR